MSSLDHPTLASLRAAYSQANFIQTKSQLVAFYVKNFIITRAVDTLKTERAQGKDVTELTKEVQAWFQDLESIKTALGPQIQNQDQSRMQYQDYTSYWFMKAKSQYQSNNYSQQLADDLATVVLLHDAYNIFNTSNLDIENNKNFAKTAHQTVINSLQKNQKHSQNPYQSTPGNPYQSTPGNPYQSGYNPYQSHNTPYGDTPNPNQSTHNQQQQQNQGPFQGFQVAESTFVPKSSMDQKKSMIPQPQPQDNTGPFQGFQIAESTFVPKSTVEQKRSMMNQQQAQPQPQPQDNTGPFQGFQAAESTFIPQSSIEQRKSMLNQQQQPQGQNQPFSTGIVNSVYQQGPPQNFQSYQGHPQGHQSGFMPPNQQHFHQSQQPYGGYNPYQQQPPHGYPQGPQGGNFNIPGAGPEQNHPNIPVNQSRNIAQSGIKTQGDPSGLVGLPDFTKFTNEDPMKGQSVNPYQQAQNTGNQNVGISQNPYNQQQQGVQNPYGGQSTNLANNNNQNPYSNANANAGGYNPLASKVGNQNVGGNPYGGMNIENTGNQNADVKKSVVGNNNIRETNTPQPEEKRPQDIRRADIGKPTTNYSVPSDQQHQLKELCLMAISELDYKNVKEAKDDIRKALDIIRRYES